jgi:hypothetical protein
MQEQKISLSRSEAFRSMPIRHKEGIDRRLISSMKEDGMLEDENEAESRERLLEAQYGSANLRDVMNPRYMRDREGKQFRIVQGLDGQHIDRPGHLSSLYPMTPDAIEQESDMVQMLQAAVENSEAERNKYLTGDQSKARVFRK